MTIRIEAVIATASPIQRRDTHGTFSEILDLGGADLDALRGAHVLDAHHQDGVDRILGSVTDAWREGDQLIARLQLSQAERHAATVADIIAGNIRAMSVGYEIKQMEARQRRARPPHADGGQVDAARGQLRPGRRRSARPDAQLRQPGPAQPRPRNPRAGSARRATHRHDR